MSELTQELLQKLVEGLGPIASKILQGIIGRVTEEYAHYASAIAQESIAWAFAKLQGNPNADVYLRELEAQTLLLAEMVKLKEKRELLGELKAVGQVMGQVALFMLKTLVL